MKNTRKRRDFLLSLIGIVLLVGMVSVAILALLGPAIGNVFSSTVSNCLTCGAGTSPGASYAYYPGDGGVPSYGGTDPVNGEPYADVFFKHAGVNPFIDTEDDPLSTFALDVDTGSYTVTRRYLTDGWGGNFPVAYWHDGWVEIWIGAGGMMEGILNAGFDGIYLDWVSSPSYRSAS